MPNTYHGLLQSLYSLSTKPKKPAQRNVHSLERINGLAFRCKLRNHSQILQRIDRIKETLLRDIDQLFGNSLQLLMNSSENSVQDRARLVADLSECFKMYDILNMRQEAEEIIRLKIVQPFARKVSDRNTFHDKLNICSVHLHWCSECSSITCYPTDAFPRHLLISHDS